jgi:hypothetical protein
MKPINIELKDKAIIKDGYPIIIPNTQKDILFKITNIKELKDYKISLTIQSKNNKSFRTNLKYDTFSIKVDDLENSKCILYLNKEDEVKGISLNKNDFEIHKVVNVNEPDKYLILLEELVEQIYDLQVKIKELEEEVYQGTII